MTERVFAEQWAAQPDTSWSEFVVRERTHAAGLLSLNAGPWWTLAKHVRTDKTARAHVQVVKIAGMKRKYLAPAGFLDDAYPDDAYPEGDVCKSGWAGR